MHLLKTDTELFLEALNHYANSHPELNVIIKKLSSNDFTITTEESDLIWTAMNNYYPLLDGVKKKKAMYISVCFDPYARKLVKSQKS